MFKIWSFDGMFVKSWFFSTTIHTRTMINALNFDPNLSIIISVIKKNNLDSFHIKVSLFTQKFTLPEKNINVTCIKVALCTWWKLNIFIRSWHCLKLISLHCISILTVWYYPLDSAMFWRQLLQLQAHQSTVGHILTIASSFVPSTDNFPNLILQLLKCHFATR